MLFLFRFSADSLSDPVCCSFFSAGRSFHRSTRYKNPICLSFPDFAPHRKLCLRSPYVPGSMYLHNAEADYPRTNREYSFTKPLSHIISIMCVTKAAEIKKSPSQVIAVTTNSKEPQTNEYDFFHWSICYVQIL